MRLKDGIILNRESADLTFGVLKFSALRRNVYVLGDDNRPTDEIKERTYDLKSPVQGRMIQVSLPATVEEKNFPYDAEVEFVGVVADTVSTANFREVETSWFLKADDIILRRNSASSNGSQNPQPPKKEPNEKQ